MADVAETTTYPDAATAISQGKRHLLVQDYTAAVTALAEGLEMLSQKLGDCDDELGEPYLLYGRALLGLAREEVGVFGGGVPGSEEADEDEEGDEDDADEDKLSDVDEKDEEMDTKESEDEKVGGEKSPEEKNPPETKKDESTEKIVEKKNEAESKKEISSEKTVGDKTEPESKKDPQESIKSEEKPATSNKTDDKKIEEQKLEKTAEPEISMKNEVESVAGTSKDPQTNGSISENANNCNGTAGKSTDDLEEDDDVNKEDDDDDPGRGIDLQVAWEVLELAKMVFVKRGEAGAKHLVETHKLLAEVAMESDNAHGAISDLKAALELIKKIEPSNPRAIAEIHYELGLAHSMENDFDASIEQFAEATTILETRIKELQDIKEPPKSDDPFYSVEGEIKELRELLPAIQEKITDMKDFKEEACKFVIEGIKNKVAAVSNGAGTSKDTAASSSSQTVTSPKIAKPASDISHLVRKKRKADDNEDKLQSPCKKPTP